MCQASIREMVAPACLVILSPLAAGTFFGVQAVFGLLTGSLGSSVQLAISMSNSGGAWDNCKKYNKNGFSEVGWEGEGVGREEVRRGWRKAMEGYGRLGCCLGDVGGNHQGFFEELGA